MSHTCAMMLLPSLTRNHDIFRRAFGVFIRWKYYTDCWIGTQFLRCIKTSNWEQATSILTQENKRVTKFCCHVFVLQIVFWIIFRRKRFIAGFSSSTRWADSSKGSTGWWSCHMTLTARVRHTTLFAISGFTKKSRWVVNHFPKRKKKTTYGQTNPNDRFRPPEQYFITCSYT